MRDIVLQASRHDQILDLPGKVPQRKSSRASYSHILHICHLIQPSSEAQAKRGEEAEYDPDQYQDPDNEVGLFSGTTYDEDDEEADKIYDSVDEQMDLRRKAKRYDTQNIA
jgi:hypothetical protein